MTIDGKKLEQGDGPMPVPADDDPDAMDPAQQEELEELSGHGAPHLQARVTQHKGGFSDGETVEPEELVRFQLEQDTEGPSDAPLDEGADGVDEELHERSGIPR